MFIQNTRNTYTDKNMRIFYASTTCVPSFSHASLSSSACISLWAVCGRCFPFLMAFLASLWVIFTMRLISISNNSWLLQQWMPWTVHDAMIEPIASYQCYFMKKKTQFFFQLIQETYICVLSMPKQKVFFPLNALLKSELKGLLLVNGFACVMYTFVILMRL